VIDDHRLGPVAEARRENGASFFILVQIQAGPPAFAADAASARQANPFTEIPASAEKAGLATP